MSYSFSVKGRTKDEATLKVRDELVKVVAAQPIHKVDCDQAFNAAEAFVKVLADDPSRDVMVNVSGSVSWGPEMTRITHANVNVAVSLETRG